MLCEQSTTSNEGPDQISTESDELIVTASGIGVRGVGDNFNFLPSDHLPWPFLRHWHFFVDPRLLGLVLIPRCWASVFDTTGWQWPPLLSFRTQGRTPKHVGSTTAFFSQPCWPPSRYTTPPYYRSGTLQSYQILHSERYFKILSIHL
jgi:hypothetical protein